MKRVYISVGSNMDAENHIRAAVRVLRNQFGELDVSTTYRNPAVGFEGEDFLNLVIGLDSDLAIPDLASVMREIENSLGRDRSLPRFSARPIDLDLLIVGNAIVQEAGIALPRDEILNYAFVLCPLAELIGDAIHPEKQCSYQKLWEKFDRANLQMIPVNIVW